MDADNELFDAACEVLEATRRLSAAACDRDCEPAVAATLGCLSAALGCLADASANLASHTCHGDRDRLPLGEFTRTLKRAARSADAARSSCVARS